MLLIFSYGIDQGFVDTIAQVNFNGNFSAAHEVVDWAGDSVALYELSLINLHLGTSQWSIQHLQKLHVPPTRGYHRV